MRTVPAMGLVALVCLTVFALPAQPADDLPKMKFNDVK